MNSLMQWLDLDQDEARREQARVETLWDKAIGWAVLFGALILSAYAIVGSI